MLLLNECCVPVSMWCSTRVVLPNPSFSYDGKAEIVLFKILRCSEVKGKISEFVESVMTSLISGLIDREI